ncbi:MAG TPA: hypothetical protein VGT44_06565 [Ktedonobacteraceae bacterium]|nr:hypothetical protein [Ktedonobacteraceae bacterium]
MRNRTARFIVGIVLVCVLALMGTGFVAAATHGGLGASGTARASVSQDKPVFGATHVYMRDEAFSPARIQVVLGVCPWLEQKVGIGR